MITFTCSPLATPAVIRPRPVKWHISSAHHWLDPRERAASGSEGAGSAAFIAL